MDGKMIDGEKLLKVLDAKYEYSTRENSDDEFRAFILGCKTMVENIKIEINKLMEEADE